MANEQCMRQAHILHGIRRYRSRRIAVSQLSYTRLLHRRNLHISAVIAVLFSNGRIQCTMLSQFL